MDEHVYTVKSYGAFMVLVLELRLSNSDESDLWADIVKWFETQPRTINDLLWAREPVLTVKFKSGDVEVRHYGDTYDFLIPNEIDCSRLDQRIEAALHNMVLPAPQPLE